VKIEEGKDEALIPMNANGGAEERTWKLVVDAFSAERAPGSQGGNGNRGNFNRTAAVSSQLFNLSVAAPYLQFSYTNATVEQGAETDLAVKVAKLKDFPGEASVKLVGLPNQAETEAKSISKDTGELVFHIKTTKDTPVGNHKNLFCEVVVIENGEPITHNLGSVALRVDKPIPPKADAPKPKVADAPKAKPANPPAKPLSRLEQLRQEAAERAKAGSGGSN
jgi:hypothetical protein